MFASSEKGVREKTRKVSMGFVGRWAGWRADEAGLCGQGVPWITKMIKALQEEGVEVPPALDWVLLLS